jgi:hypothetical protein
MMWRKAGGSSRPLRRRNVKRHLERSSDYQTQSCTTLSQDISLTPTSATRHHTPRVPLKAYSDSTSPHACATPHDGSLVLALFALPRATISRAISSPGPRSASRTTRETLLQKRVARKQ